MVAHHLVVDLDLSTMVSWDAYLFARHKHRKEAVTNWDMAASKTGRC